jgi:hypothetical protein
MLVVIHSSMLDEKDSDDGLRGGVGRKMRVIEECPLDPDRGDMYERSPRLLQHV